MIEDALATRKLNMAIESIRAKKKEIE